MLDELDRRAALIVHFSHRANMRSGGVFPDDLLAAIANKNLWPLSWCVLWPDHPMELPGEAGMIFRSSAIDQILSVSNRDSGSSAPRDGQDQSGGQPLTAGTLTETFTVKPGGYNEWRVRGADVAGIYLHRPEGVEAKADLPLVVDGVEVARDIGPAWFPIQEIHAAFGDLPLIIMTSHGPEALSRPSL